MRILLAESSRELLFQSLQQTKPSLSDIAKQLCVSTRTVSDWKRGKYTIPEEIFGQFVLMARLRENELIFDRIDEITQKRNAGKIGGARYYQKYGVLGTLHDKKKGGRSSYNARKNMPDDIFERKKIYYPNESYELAEFIGICMGDGNITKYQVTISLHAEDDADYAEYITGLGMRLFGVIPRIYRLKHARCINIVFDSRSLVEFLVSKGLPIGDKIAAGLDIPHWILDNTSLSMATIRGLFDTDGSVFEERHKINNKTYAYVRWSFVSASEKLLDTVCDVLSSNDLKPKIRSGRSVNLEHFTDIEKYFKMIGSSNQKHLDRLAAFGGVA